MSKVGIFYVLVKLKSYSKGEEMRAIRKVKNNVNAMMILRMELGLVFLMTFWILGACAK